MAFDDGTLLERIAAGEDDALRRLYESYRPRLWRYVWQLVSGDDAFVEEVLQDVFVAIWRHAGAYRGEAPVATWIFRIAHNQAANMRRARARRPVLGQSQAERADGEQRLFTSLEAETVERMTLGDALRSLPPKHRDVLELVFAAGFSCEEAAHILAVPVGTVKSRLSAARKALAAWLQAETREEAHHDA